MLLFKALSLSPLRSLCSTYRNEPSWYWSNGNWKLKSENEYYLQLFLL